MLFNKFLPYKRDNIRKEFVRAYYSGYMKNDVEATIKDKFDEILRREIKYYISLAKCVDYRVNIKTIEDIKKLENCSIEIKLPQKYNSNINAFVIKECNIISIHANRPVKIMVDSMINKLIPNSKDSEQAGYIKYLLDKFGARGGKFRKNDIIDMLLLGALTRKDMILLTFDDEIIKYLKTINHRSYRFIRRLYIQ